MPRVKISANNLVMPSSCVCCGYPGEVSILASASKSRGKRVVHTTTRGFEFPICRACHKHCDIEPNGTMHLSVSLLVILALACTPLAPLIVFWLPAALVIYLWRKASARAGRGHSCESMGAPVVMENFYAREYTFYFDSGRFAGAFAQANAQAGKNVLGVDLGGGPVVTVGPTPVWKILAVPGAFVAVSAILGLVAWLTKPGTEPSPPAAAVVAAQPSMAAPSPAAVARQAPMVAAPSIGVYQPPMVAPAPPAEPEEPRRHRRHHRH